MEPMKPMAPMEPMEQSQPWWSGDLGHPSSSGSQKDMRYAFFPEKARLLIEQNGKIAIYDSGDHRINGVSQQQGHGQDLTFTSQNGTVELGRLRKID